jgi:hypothetical protein
MQDEHVQAYYDYLLRTDPKQYAMVAPLWDVILNTWRLEALARKRASKQA